MDTILKASEKEQLDRLSKMIQETSPEKLPLVAAFLEGIRFASLGEGKSA